ncbi:MAG: formate dehydrogenase accessory protein FdhE [Gemmatimonadaceae bacterium]
MTSAKSIAALELDETVPRSLSLALHRLRSVYQAARFFHSELPNARADVKWARIRLAEGIPALAGEWFLEWMRLDSIVYALIAVYEAGPNDSASSAVRRDVDFLVSEVGEQQLVEAAFAGAWDDLANVRTPEGAETRQATLKLLDYATRPSLQSAARSLRDVIAESGWTRGTCPCCGALPLLAELHSKKDAHARLLRCGRCASSWSIERLACPACGERDHAKLRYLHVDGEVEHRRVECCTTCGFYVKAVATLDAFSDEKLFDVDLETVALDAIALEAGYHRRST